MSSFKERIERKCEHFWLGSGIRGRWGGVGEQFCESKPNAFTLALAQPSPPPALPPFDQGGGELFLTRQTSKNGRFPIFGASDLAFFGP